MVNEWGVVGVIIALVGLGGAVIKPMLSLNTAIVKLTEAVNSLKEDIAGIKKEMSEFVNGNHNSHVRIHNRIDECADELRAHESRIKELENR